MICARLTPFLILLAVAGPATAKTPNILMLFADDLGRYASAYADPDSPSANDIIHTPVFDSIAAQGVLFENAFVSAPSCTPCRGSIYTGRHFFRNGSASQLHNPWTKGFEDPFTAVQGMPNTLAKAGYHIGWSHKWHLPDRLCGGKKHNYQKHGNKISDFSQVVSAAPDADSAKNAVLEEVRGNFRDFLAERKGDQPFFYSFNPTNTHRPWVAGSGKKLWGLNPDELKGRLPACLPDEPVVREDFADYLGEAMAFDAACGIILKELEALGELDNTLVCITGDHGAPGFPDGKCNVGDFGARVLLTLRWPEKIRRDVIQMPVSLIDLAPTFLAAAGLESPDNPNGQNLLPALATDDTDDQLRGWALTGREVHLREARQGGLPYPIRALRTADFLYVINFKPERNPMGDPLTVTEDSAPDWDTLVRNTRAAFADMDGSPTKAWLVQERHNPDFSQFVDIAWGKRPAEELYDLRKDPQQTLNVAAEPSYADTKADLRRRLMAELAANQDPRLDHDAFDRQPYNPPAPTKR